MHGPPFPVKFLRFCCYFLYETASRARAFIASKHAQLYTGGTLVADGEFRLASCNANGECNNYYGADGSEVTIEEGAVLDFDGNGNHHTMKFVLAGGDTRLISGPVGIHRIIRMSSTATTRAELNAELRAVYDRVRSYLERNGAAVAVADAMMAVPNRSLRLLTVDELRLFGLDGVNPAQDDLDRLRLMRKCGEDFVTRRDSFTRAFDLQCKSPSTDLDALNACGLDLRQRFGFPDETCPAESPLSEFDTGTGLVLAPPPPGDAVGQGSEG